MIIEMLKWVLVIGLSFVVFCIFVYIISIIQMHGWLDAFDKHVDIKVKEYEQLNKIEDGKE